MPADKNSAQQDITLPQPTPLQQRLGVLANYSLSVNEAKLFKQAMMAEGVPANRLLTADDNLASAVPGVTEYQAECLVFNTRYQYQPFVIVMCHNTREVQLAYQLATESNLPVRVRAGGHDHAGESSGDSVVLIDVTNIKDFEIAPADKNHVATIGAGHRFYELTPKLADEGRMIAHGTCATVGITGFIQGGGWGPWTRKYGMCCEHLVGAVLVLGDGSVVKVHEGGGYTSDAFDMDGEPVWNAAGSLCAEANSNLLWALRGGGGMSYGIITRLFVNTFDLPETIYRFSIPWNGAFVKDIESASCSTLKVLQTWERVINDTTDKTEQLLGTNLQIDALPVVPATDTATGDTENIEEMQNKCLMYGYWDGDIDSLKGFVEKYFGGSDNANVDPAYNLWISQPHGKIHNEKYPAELMSDWGRNSMYEVMQEKGLKNVKVLEGTPFTPDYDAPAPHKITSRLVTADGLASGEGYTQFLQTMSSPLIHEHSRENSLNSYVTLGAIKGSFYWQSEMEFRDSEEWLGVSFPYRDCQYTIQYQTWWNTLLINKLRQQNNPILVDVNRAMDWIDAGRDAKIDGTKGAFISFKDASIPTETYFQESYQKLVSVKRDYSQDEYDRLRTRKTIY